MQKYTFYSDPGHGWLAVPIAELYRLGIAGKISSYSYERGGTAYLEEDGDAGLFIEAKKRAGVNVTFNEVNHPGDSWIRGCQHYTGTQSD